MDISGLRRVVRGAALAAFVLLMAACGGEADPTPTSAPATATSTPPAGGSHCHISGAGYCYVPGAHSHV